MIPKLFGSKNKKGNLPQIGEIFKIDKTEYKVVFVNEGKNRFSAEPVYQKNELVVENKNQENKNEV